MYTTTLPHKITLDFSGGKFATATLTEVTQIRDAAGNLLAEKFGEPGPLPLPLAEEILGKINRDLLATIAERDAEIVALSTAPAASQEPPPASIVAETITKLHAAFSSTLPGDVQVAFAMPYAIVRVLVEAEQWQLAAAVIQSVAVPPELEEAKAGLISILPL